MHYPENKDQLQTIIKAARSSGRPLVPVSSGPPHLHGASENAAAEIVNFSKMNRIFRVDEQNRYAWIEPGVTFSELIPEMAKNGLRLNIPFMPKPQKSVIASMLEREPVLTPKYQYDYTDPLLALEVVFGTGDDFRTGSASGPGPLEGFKADKVNPWGPGSIDYMRFLSGAQGTMGFVTWATLKAEILPRMSRIYFIEAETPGALTKLANRLLRQRVSDECVILNAVNFSAAFSENETEAIHMRGTLAPWTMVCRICGFDRYPEKRIMIYEKYLTDACGEHGLSAQQTISGSEGLGQRVESRITDCDRSDVYWKLRQGGGLKEVFFLAPPSKTPDLIECAWAESAGYPHEKIGVTLQPQVQGRAFHVGFDLYYDALNTKEAETAESLYQRASRELFARGAYFSRPYGFWPELVYANDPEGVRALRTIKSIFDPDGILNPGKLCFSERNGH